MLLCQLKSTHGPIEQTRNDEEDGAVLHVLPEVTLVRVKQPPFAGEALGGCEGNELVNGLKVAPTLDTGRHVVITRMSAVPMVAPSGKYLALAATNSSAGMVWSSARGLKPVYKGSATEMDG